MVWGWAETLAVAHPFPSLMRWPKKPPCVSPCGRLVLEKEEKESVMRRQQAVVQQASGREQGVAPLRRVMPALRKFVRMLRFALVAAFLLSSSLLFFPSLASAHAYVIGSDPVDGSTIQTVPDIVRIFFNAPLSVLSIARVYHTENGGFVEVPTIRSFVSPLSAKELDTPLLSASTLPQGSYFVRWSAIASDDGHITYGAIGFDVGYSSTGLSGVSTLGPTSSNALSSIQLLDAIGILSVAWNWLTLLALVFWVGLLIAERLIIAPIERGPALLVLAHKQSLSLQWLSLLVLLIGEAVSLLMRVLRFNQVFHTGFQIETVGQFILNTTYGQLWGVRVALLLVALLWLRWTRRSLMEQHVVMGRDAVTRQPATDAVSTMTAQARITRDFSLNAIPTGHLALLKRQEISDQEQLTPSRRDTILWLCLAGLLLFTRALSSDVAQVAPLHLSAVVLDWLYLCAQCTWFGSLTFIGYTLLPIIQRENLTETLTTLLRRLSAFVLVGMLVLLVSGLFLAEATIRHGALLLTDAYGRTLLVNALLTVFVLLMSLYLLITVRLRLSRQTMLLPVVGAELPARRTRQTALTQTQRHLRKGIKVTSFGMGAILFCAALMSFYAPPIVFPALTYSDPVAHAPATTGTMQTQQVGLLSISLQVFPGKAGNDNTIQVMLTDSSGNPVTDATIQLTINMTVMDMGTAHAILTGSNGMYTSVLTKNSTLSMAGLWNILVTVQRPNLPPAQALFPVSLK